MIIRTLKDIAVFLFLYYAIQAGILLLPAPIGLVVGGGIAWWTLHHYLMRAGREGAPRRWATLRLRPLQGATLRWTLVAVPVFLVLFGALEQVYIRLVPLSPETLNPFGPLVSNPLGRLNIALLAIPVASLLEEFFFRGILQRRFEQRWGPGRAILGASALFALVHWLPWILPLHFLLGIVFGWAVYTTRSIWAGVILHAANNSAAVLALGGISEFDAQPTLWETGPTPDWWLTLAALALSLLAAVWVARRLHNAGRDTQNTELARGTA